MPGRLGAPAAVAAGLIGILLGGREAGGGLGGEDGVGEDRPGGDLEHGLTGHAEPVEGRQRASGVDAEAAAGEGGERGDLDLVAQTGVVGGGDPSHTIQRA